MSVFQVETPLSHTPTPASPSRKRFGCLGWFTWYNAGFWGGGFALFLLFSVFNLLVAPRHTNILLLGLDRRPDEGIAARTDTMILVGVQPRPAAITMLSIPRDLWVTLPNGDQQRINVAHRFAELNEPGAGPRAAMDTVELNFGVEVDRYVRVDFQGFVDIIDAAGGVTIDVPAPFYDYEYPTDDGGTMYVEFEAGVQHMDGERALQYARIRHGSSDFVRAGRQQQVIAAFIRRLLSPLNWPRLPAVYYAVNSAAETNLTPWQLLRLAPSVFWVGPEGIDRVVMEPPMVQGSTSPGGGSILLPVWGEVEPLLVENFNKTTP